MLFGPEMIMIFTNNVARLPVRQYHTVRAQSAATIFVYTSAVDGPEQVWSALNRALGSRAPGPPSQMGWFRLSAMAGTAARTGH